MYVYVYIYFKKSMLQHAQVTSTIFAENVNLKYTYLIIVHE